MHNYPFPSDAWVYYISLKIIQWMSFSAFFFNAGMLKESQQWEIYVEGSARCAHAEGPQVPPTTSGLVDLSSI